MSLLNFFNTGGVAGALGTPTTPTAKPFNVNGLLGNPLLQIGLGILANNNSRNFSQNVGRGALQGMNNIQQFQQQKIAQDMNEARMKQFDMLNKQQNERLQREQAERLRQQQAIEQLVKTRPDLKDIASISPERAIEMAYPKKGVPNYVTERVTLPDGSTRIVKIDKSGGPDKILEINGKPVTPAMYDPSLLGNLAYSKQYASSGAKLTDKLPGTLATEQQIIDMTKGGFSAPQSPQMPQSLPNQYQIPPIVQAERDKVRMQILLDEQRQYGGVGANPNLDAEIANMQQRTPASRGFGIPVPTKAQEAGEVKSATLNAQSSAEEASKLKEMERNFPNLEKVASELSDLGKKATYTMAGQAVDSVRRQLGFDVGEGAIARREYIAKVDNEILPLLRQTFGAAFTAKEGESLKATLGDTDASPEEKDAVLKAFIETKRSQIEALKGGTQIMPRNEQMPKQRSREDILKQYGVK